MFTLVRHSSRYRPTQLTYEDEREGTRGEPQKYVKTHSKLQWPKSTIQWPPCSPQNHKKKS